MFQCFDIEEKLITIMITILKLLQFIEQKKYKKQILGFLIKIIFKGMKYNQ